MQEHRLKKTDEFSSVFLFRKVKSGTYLKIHYKPNNLSYSRLGLVVSKRINKRANKRNYMKRLMRELFRTTQQHWHGVDIIIRITRSFTPDDYANVESEFMLITDRFNNK